MSFKARDNFFLLFVAVRSKAATFGPVWFVPSHKFEASAMEVGPDANRSLRFSASAKPETNDKWRVYRLDTTGGPREEDPGGAERRLNLKQT